MPDWLWLVAAGAVGWAWGYVVGRKRWRQGCADYCPELQAARHDNAMLYERLVEAGVATLPKAGNGLPPVDAGLRRPGGITPAE